MPDLAFSIGGAEPVLYSAAPELALKLSVTNAQGTSGQRTGGTGTNGTPSERIHGVLLRCQIRIDAPRRTHEPDEAAKLRDLFGPPAEWGRTMRSLLWTQVSLVVPAFDERVTLDLPLPCSYDFALATTKYFHALAAGLVPLTLLFSGTLFHATPDTSVRASPISWQCEARYDLPHHVYADTLAHYFPNGVPLSLHREVFDRLLQVRITRGFATWERTIESLLGSEGRPE